LIKSRFFFNLIVHYTLNLNQPKKMNKLLYLLCFLVLSIGNLYSQDLNYSTLDDSLIEELEISGKTYFDVYILLEDKVDVEGLDRTLSAAKVSPEVRAKTVLSALQSKAASSQSAIMDKMSKDNGIVSQTINSYWIANTIFFTANAKAIARLSNDDRVQIIGLDGQLELEESIDEGLATILPNGVEPGLDAINVRPLWEMGYTGYGQLALVADTGIDPSHTAYAGRYRGNTNGDDEGWYRFTGQAATPFQCGDHGSHVLGTLLGLDLATQDTIGVAFDAQWMGSANLCGGGTQSNIGTFQWSTNPDGDFNTTEDMADVVNNSWWDPSVQGSECNSVYVDVLTAVEAAGVAVVFSAGNAGPEPETITSPKNISIDLVNVFSVAALSVDGNGRLDVAGFSSHGPSVCEGEGSLLIKPEVSAPGVGVRSVALQNAYGFKSGTSMAAPHVSGSILVLKQAFPNATSRELKLALYNSCRDLGEPGEDNIYGRGIIDVYAAYNYMIAEGFVPTPAVGVNNDVVALNIITDPVECDEMLTGEFIFLNNTRDTLRSADLTFSIDGVLDEASTINWTGELAPRGIDTVVLSDLAFPLGPHTLEVNISNPNGEMDERALNNTIVKEIIISDKRKLENITVEGQMACGEGTQLVRAEFLEEGLVQWFDSQVGGNLLGEGSQFAMTALETPTTIYGDILRSASVGPRGADDITLSSEIRDGITFDVSSPLNITSFDFYSEDVGIIFVGVENGRGDQIDTELVRSDGTGWQTSDVDIRLAEGVNYRMLYNEGPIELGVSAGVAQYPYVAERDQNLRITGDENGAPLMYKYFYNFAIQYLDFCGRIPVEIEAVAVDTSPIAVFHVNTTFVEFEENQEIEFTNSTTDGVSYLWNFDDGATSTEENPTYLYTQPGIYFPSLIVTGATGCTDAFVVRVDIISNEDPLSTRDLAPSNSFTLAPNPVTSRVDFTTSSPIQVDEIKLFNSAGQLVKNYSVHNKINYHGIDVSDLVDGLYYFVIQTEQGLETHKVIKL